MSEVKDKLVAYNARQKERLYVKIKIFTSWVIYGIIAGVIAYGNPSIQDLVFLIGYAYGVATFFWYIIFRSANESYEIEICSHFSKAAGFVKMTFTEDEKNAKRHRDRAVEEIDYALGNVDHLVRSSKPSEILGKTMLPRLTAFKTNVKTLLSPRVAIGEDMYRMQSILDGLVSYFGEQWESFGIQHLDEINKNLESLGVPPKQLKTLASTFRESMKKKPVIIGISILVGFGISAAIIAASCQFLSLNFVEWARANLGVFILGGVGVSALVSSVLNRA